MPQIRRLVREDASTFRDIRLEGLRRHPEAFGSSLSEEEDRPFTSFGDTLERGLVLGGGLVAEQLDGVVGLYVPESAKTRHKGVLWGMYVRPEARNAGLGGALVRELIARARQSVEDVTLSVGADNRAAIACYQAVGFEPYGLDRRALKVGGIYVDELLMSLRLSSA